jgi:hypothetical protein
VVARHVLVMNGLRQAAPGRGLVAHARRVFFSWKARWAGTGAKVLG